MVIPKSQDVKNIRKYSDGLPNSGKRNSFSKKRKLLDAKMRMVERNNYFL